MWLLLGLEFELAANVPELLPREGSQRAEAIGNERAMQAGLGPETPAGGAPAIAG